MNNVCPQSKCLMKLPRHSKVCVFALGSPQKNSQKNHPKSQVLPVQSKKTVQRNESCPSLAECLTGNFMCPKRPVVSRELLWWEGVCFTMDWEASAALGSRCVVIISNHLLVCPLESANIADITAWQKNWIAKWDSSLPFLTTQNVLRDIETGWLSDFAYLPVVSPTVSPRFISRRRGSSSLSQGIFKGFKYICFEEPAFNGYTILWVYIRREGEAGWVAIVERFDRICLNWPSSSSVWLIIVPFLPL